MAKKLHIETIPEDRFLKQLICEPIRHNGVMYMPGDIVTLDVALNADCATPIAVEDDNGHTTNELYNDQLGDTK